MLLKKSLLLRVCLPFLLFLFLSIHCQDQPTECAFSGTIQDNFTEWQLNIETKWKDGDNDWKTVIALPKGAKTALEIKKGTTFTISCKNPGEVFVNEIRGIKDVNLTMIDQDPGNGKIIMTCSSQTDTKFTPRIFQIVKWDGRNRGFRHVYCQPGCTRWIEYSHNVVYPPGTLSKEKNSAPVTYTNQPIELSCKDGFVRAEVDLLPTKVYCNQTMKAWSNSNDNTMKCVRGCKDVRKLSGGSCPMKSRGKEGQAPFKTGDILAFTCNSGKTLTGYSTVTCDATNLWSDDLPKCG